ncbi:glyoxylate reductase/D-3-phosphoglycerate dehydrogenase [Anaerospora hongkongensis]|uniref:Glyoxylate reductase/D-3-phosphoglycerate dehydrogenase n=1 Tax=Anaerospora hongkongensis TaxID=244830 RepID=A0A4R1QA94_9FIRM|nr:2-hydroxyacid dehydrogenase [Anaerospora hongkongensis]TCL39845.1 glyoxylate reductase/D-3-phosphoglycerate dehydrogenase [Anaerospora hongkongensis]
MKKVLFFSGLRQDVVTIFGEMMPEGFELAWHSHSISNLEKVRLIREAEFLVLHPGELADSVLQEAKSLHLIQLLTAGYDKINLKLAGELGIPVATNGGANAWAVAEHTVALLLTLYRRLIACDQSVREGKWRQAVTGFDTFEVAGKTVGLLGAGNIGRKVAWRLKSFETNIIYYDTNSSPELEAELGAKRVSLDELVKEADIITIHLPLLRETRSLLGEREFLMMKKNAVILNPSRGEIVDEDALIAALKEKRIAGAGLDVFHQEPIAVSNPLLALDNVVLSPHVAGHAYEGWFRRSRFAWENIQRVAVGEKPISVARLNEE